MLLCHPWDSVHKQLYLCVSIDFQGAKSLVECDGQARLEVLKLFHSHHVLRTTDSMIICTCTISLYVARRFLWCHKPIFTLKSVMYMYEMITMHLVFEAKVSFN